MRQGCGLDSDRLMQVIGEAIPLSPFQVAVSPGAADAAQCVAFGEGLLSACFGVQGSFSIQAKDKYGNQLVGGGDKFEVQLDEKACPVCPSMPPSARALATSASSSRTETNFDETAATTSTTRPPLQLLPMLKGPGNEVGPSP